MTRTAYLAIRRWVDRDLAKGTTAVSHLLGFAGVIPAILFRDHPGWAATSLLVAGVVIGTAWTAFVIWRAYRYFRAASIKGDRQFDQHDRYRLPVEYHQSESATAAHRRKVKARGLKHRKTGVDPPPPLP